MESMARILIVDDDPASIEVLDNALEGIGEVRCATSGPDALALLLKYPIDLVLLDARMPGMDGFATCHAMQRYYPDIPIIFVAVASDFGSEIRALKAGASDFISKPINPPVVRARVGVHLKLKARIDLRRLRSADRRSESPGTRRTAEPGMAARRPPSATRGDACLHQVAQMLAASSPDLV